MTNKAADAYAEYLLREEESTEVLKQICEEHGVVGDHIAVIGHAYLDEDDMPKDKIMMHEYMDAHGLLLELQAEREKLISDKLTHVCIGFASNNKVVKVIELLSERALTVAQIQPNEEEGVRFTGQMMSKTVGLYAARIVAASKMDKDIILVGPPGM